MPLTPTQIEAYFGRSGGQHIASPRFRVSAACVDRSSDGRPKFPGAVVTTDF